jgi:hypothetical protein
MTPHRAIFQRSRRQLNLLAVGIFVSLTLVFGSIYVRDTLKKSVASNQAQLAAQQSILASKQMDLQAVQTHIAQFRALKQQGLVGIADREGWVEQLAASRAQLMAGETLAYTLKPPQSLEESTPDQPAPVVAVDPAGISGVPTRHDLDFELGGVHEAELLALLQVYKTKVHGSFRVQSCRLGNPASTGLLAQCTLRFFNLPEAVRAQ